MEAKNRNEMQSNLFPSSLETIRVHKSELANITFKDNGKEIIFNGEMYDVKIKSESGNYITFTCKHDEKETTLLAGLDKQVKNNTDSNTPAKKQNDSSKNPVKDLFFYENNFVPNESNAVEFPSVFYVPIIIGITSYIGPPPEVAVA